MARPRKKPKINHGRNRTRIDDLDDHMLTQILVRLPNRATVIACSPVNKRWFSLISDPNFPVQFANHKKKTATGSDHEDDEPPCTFITIMKSWRQLPFTEFIFGPRKLSLFFLPGRYTSLARATYKDLVLCTNYRTFKGGGLVYYIANPFTKQWVALPPYPSDKSQGKRITKFALICQSTKFRVVEIRIFRKDSSVDTFNMVVYCSEIGEWKEINLRIPEEVGQFRVSADKPEIVVCNDIIYFKSGLRLVALDPFDVNDACDTTLEARVMPPLPKFGYLQESSGHLLAVCTLKGNNVPSLWYEIDVTATLELGMVVWKLDPNQVPLQWETTFQGLCKGIVNCIDIYTTIWNSNTRLERHITTKGIGVHPYNDKLIYMYLAPTKQVVLCDTRTGCITSSEDLSYDAVRFHRLEQQWWPTSVPSLVQCLTVEEN
ncbi:uncharacterized protein LOC141627747 [Silene latifolia]|uniref:uncharacterized protein LOC141627747 n=1 Tax=Silene latifolia TaxID=37657 RepID=UPI003D770DD8